MWFRMTPFGAACLGLAMVAPQVATSNVRTALEVSDAWANPTAPGQTVAAGYLELKNRTDRNYTLVAASSPVAAATQIHTIAVQGGVARMRQVSNLPLPARGELKLAPGGNHLMLIGLKQRLVQGQRVPVTLRFAGGAEINTMLQVQAGAAHQHKSGGHHGHR